MLVPELRPGDIVIIDNLPAHKGTRVEALIAAAGGGANADITSLTGLTDRIGLCW